MNTPPPQIIDSHCHIPLLLNGKSCAGIDDTLAMAAANGVTHMLTVCVDLETFPSYLGIARSHLHIHTTVGIHPENTAPYEPDVATLTAYAQDERVLAIGETGLDYYRSPDQALAQQERFRRHIRAAREIGKPLIIHSRAARDDVISLLRQEKARDVGGIMHCFVDDYDTAAAAMQEGFLISFSGIVTFRNAVPLQDVARRIPLQSMLVETDSPYLAPVPFRGKPNQPAYVKHVADFISRLREVPYETIAAETTRNYFKLFPQVGAG